MKTDNPEAFGKVYNVGTGKQTSLNDLFKLIKASLIDIYKENRNNKKVEQISSIEPIYDSLRKGDVRHSIANIDRVKLIIGYKPVLNIKDGLSLTCKFYMDIRQ